ncbi:NYN domain-containing protein [Mycobacterium sp. SMC-4]|uniref:NYN domain-containing protein n=1 Tax=Mycobacterium sp. SMC-4 TaxID=2857059 RepID=UPI0021B317D7|nr:NYN domain-containing protein [Mycobacterium sp. SMC-4]UXA19632.1 NYN domain-containing protein [Mycobacterium sp. SMC-4]
MHWIVDGMNVIGCRPDGWWRHRRRAMAALVENLDQWASAEQLDVTVVFEKPPSPPLGSTVITVTHAAVAAPNSADDEILRLLSGMADPCSVQVATSDRGLAERVRAAGATVFPAERLRQMIDPPSAEGSPAVPDQRELP